MVAKRIFNEFTSLFPEYAEDVYHYKELSGKRNTITLDLMDGKNYEFTFTSKHDWCLKISGPKFKGA